MKESEERLEEEKQSRMEVQKAAWLAKKKEISGRWKVNEVKKDRDMGEMVEVDDLKEDTQHDNVKEHTFLDEILADIGVNPMKVEDDNNWEKAELRHGGVDD